MTIAIEQIIRVHDEKEKVFLEIGDYTDAPDFIEIRTTDKSSIAWFGQLSITGTPEFIQKLGEALITVAKAKSKISQ